MSKILLAADLHIHNWTNYPAMKGTRLSWCVEALRQIDAYAHKNKINQVILAGDTFHTYGKVDAEALYYVNKIVSKALQEGRTYYLILGNHEVAIKSDLKVNILDAIHRAVVIDEIKYTPVPCGISLWLVPYYPTREEYLEVLVKISEEVSGIRAQQKNRTYALISHVAVEEFMPAPSNSISSYKIPIKDFASFDFVFLGHYHERQKLKNIQYIGAPIQHTVGENTDKGFLAFDTETKEVKFHALKLPRIKKIASCEIPLLSQYGENDIIIVETSDKKERDRILKERPQTIVNLLPEISIPESRLKIESGENLEGVLDKYLDYHEIKEKEEYLKVLREVV